MYSSLWNNPALKIGGKVIVWDSWLAKGITKISDLVDKTILKSYQDLETQFNLKKSDFWRYLQIRSSLSRLLDQLPEQDGVVQTYFKLPRKCQSASMLYKMSSRATLDKNESLRLIWQKDLNDDIDQDLWLKIVSTMGWFTREVRGKLTHYKILHRFYYIPLRLFKMGVLENNLCWKCGNHEGTFIHVIWSCPVIQPFWRQIIRTIEKWLGTTVPESARLCLLGDRSCLPNVSKGAFALALTGFILAAKVILRHWKNPNGPAYEEWVKSMTDLASYELLVAKLQNRKEEHLKTWDVFLTYLKGQTR